MKRLLLIPLLLLLALPCQAQEMVARMNPYIMGAGVTAASTTAYCTGAAACTATTPGQCDLLCDDFEGSTDCGGAGDDTYCRNAYTVTIDSGDAIVFNATASGTYPCAGTTNSRVAKITVAGTYNTTNFVFNSGSARPILYSQFYLRVNSESIADGGEAVIFSGCSTVNCSVLSHWVTLIQAAGQLKLVLNYYNGVGWSTITSSAISVATWYRINTKHDYTNTAVQLWIDGASQGTAADVGNRTSQYQMFGERGQNSNVFEIEIDNIAFDDDTIQGTCP